MRTAEGAIVREGIVSRVTTPSLTIAPFYLDLPGLNRYQKLTIHQPQKTDGWFLMFGGFNL
ncbi:MAG: hypothetical protein ACR2GW_01610 [Pyrinomonadaceae bacterium]|nr:hypothetical protein [Pyrinomonadaceae bacterium]